MVERRGLRGDDVHARVIAAERRGTGIRSACAIPGEENLLFAISRRGLVGLVLLDGELSGARYQRLYGKLSLSRSWEAVSCP